MIVKKQNFNKQLWVFSDKIKTRYKIIATWNIAIGSLVIHVEVSHMEKKSIKLPEGKCCEISCFECKYLDKNDYKAARLTFGIGSGYRCSQKQKYVKFDDKICNSYAPREEDDAQ